jgi:multidrug efflux pump subunit AcrA (membrane-fusion protein)
MPVIDRRPEASLLRGTLTTFRRRCGKPSCHCATGAPHESPALTYTEGGRTKTLTLTDAEVTEVAAALARYQEASAALLAAADAGLAALRARRQR